MRVFLSVAVIGPGGEERNYGTIVELPAVPRRGEIVALDTRNIFRVAEVSHVSFDKPLVRLFTVDLFSPSITTWQDYEVAGTLDVLGWERLGADVPKLP